MSAIFGVPKGATDPQRKGEDEGAFELVTLTSVLSQRERK
jgi:hypothetical protein